MDTKTIAMVVVGILVGAGIGMGIGYFVFDGDNDEETYSFYIYFDVDDERNGWYSASASNANDAFSRAMDNAGFEWTKSSGYISSIDGVNDYWYTAQYLYTSTDEDAAIASIGYPSESNGSLEYSNGWKAIAGYGEETDSDLKLNQLTSTIFFFSVYGAIETPSPVTVTDWMNSGPFAA